MRYDKDIPDAADEEYGGEPKEQREQKRFWKRHYRKKQMLREKEKLRKEITNH